MEKIKRGYYNYSSSSSSDDESYIKNEEKIISNDIPSIKVFTGTENTTRKAFQRFEEKQNPGARRSSFAQQQEDQDSDSHTISQESDAEPVAYLKKTEERAYLDAITDSQVIGDHTERREIEKRENVFIDPEMLKHSQQESDNECVPVGLVSKTEEEEEEEEVIQTD